MRRLLLCFWLMGAIGFAIGLAQEQELLGIKRVFVEQLNGGDSAYQIRDLIVGALQNSKLFVVTENRERADVVMRGSAGDTTFEDTFQSSDSINARAYIGNGNGSASKNNKSSRAPADMSVGQSESARINERKHEAIATVRLINKDGDVIWSTTQESLGGKFRGASADVADKITRQLAADIEKAKKGASLK
jgi:hypothetical protein